MAGKHRTVKAQLTRSSLGVAAAIILREQGPSSVTYRHVAGKAGAASSSVGYYFDSIDDLLREAAEYNVRMWARRAEKAADAAEDLTREEARAQVVELLLQACLPEDLVVPVAHYEQLMTAAESSVVTTAYRRGRERLDDAVSRILRCAGLSKVNPRIVAAVVDGAAVAGISEGHPVREAAHTMLSEAIGVMGEAQQDEG